MTAYLDIRNANSNYEMFLIPALILKIQLRGQNLQIPDNTVKYIKHGIFGIAEFVFEVITTVTFINIAPKRAGTIKLQNYLTTASSISIIGLQSLNSFLILAPRKGCEGEKIIQSISNSTCQWSIQTSSSGEGVSQLMKK